MAQEVKTRLSRHEYASFSIPWIFVPPVIDSEGSVLIPQNIPSLYASNAQKNSKYSNNDF